MSVLALFQTDLHHEARGTSPNHQYHYQPPSFLSPPAQEHFVVSHRCQERPEASTQLPWPRHGPAPMGPLAPCTPAWLGSLSSSPIGQAVPATGPLNMLFPLPRMLFSPHLNPNIPSSGKPSLKVAPTMSHGPPWHISFMDSASFSCHLICTCATCGCLSISSRP